MGYKVTKSGNRTRTVNANKKTTSSIGHGSTKHGGYRVTNSWTSGGGFKTTRTIKTASGIKRTTVTAKNTRPAKEAPGLFGTGSRRRASRKSTKGGGFFFWLIILGLAAIILQ